MLTRILRVNMAVRLNAKLQSDQLTVSQLAKRLGLARQTIAAMINDDWEYITRDAVERIADYAEVSANDLFEFVDVDFWRPIREAKTCTFLRGFERSRSTSTDFKLPRYDKESTETVENFLYEFFPDFGGGILAPHRESEAQLIARASQETCIVIGSPKSNEACEILLSNFFGAKPFDGSRANRQRIPFGFCWPESDDVVKKSSLTCSDIAREEANHKPGIVLKGIHIAADYKPMGKFVKWSTVDSKVKYGRDCGLIFVANKPFGTTPVKLIVLAGLSGIGTLAAAKALVKNFRDLEPLEDQTYVYGIVEGRYTKAANTVDRKYHSFDWRYRLGGRLPIEPQPSDRTIPR